MRAKLAENGPSSGPFGQVIAHSTMLTTPRQTKLAENGLSSGKTSGKRAKSRDIWAGDRALDDAGEGAAAAALPRAAHHHRRRYHGPVSVSVCVCVLCVPALPRAAHHHRRRYH
eukprot:2942862-Rhodomonas_salina.2